MTDRDQLIALGLTGLDAAITAAHESGLMPGRVVRSDRGYVFVLTTGGIAVARPATKLLKDADDGGLPVVGDWVLLDGTATEPIVEVVLDRVTSIARRDPGKAARVQVLAANVDVVLITHPLSEPPNLSRIERELALVWDSGAVPVIVLTKSDLSDDVAGARAQVLEVAPGVDVHVTSAADGVGLDEIRAYMDGGRTCVLIGSSGSGKSTLINALAGEDIRQTREVRLNDGRGRHTTVSRELIGLPGGGLVIDTPGLRAVGMWETSDGLAQAFADIDELAAGCRFRDCGHNGEPGCAVEAAVTNGTLAERRLASYRELQAEIAHVSAQLDVRARLERKSEEKAMARTIKRFYRER